MLKAGEVAAGGRSSHRGATGLSRSSKTADSLQSAEVLRRWWSVCPSKCQFGPLGLGYLIQITGGT